MFGPRCFVAGVALTIAQAAPASAQRVQPELDQFVRSIVQRGAPLAIAVVVVQGDSVVHLAGYGLRDRERSLPVTPASSFYIASSTKSFTALTAALLAARGVVDLDAPVTRYAPEFRLPAPMDASRTTLRRLLSHRAGFESDPVSFRTAYTGDLVPDSVLAVAGRSAVPVDTTFTYTNTAFIVAARVLERATGTRWQELVAREVLNPLGLRRTTAVPSSARGWELVQGYGPGPDGFRVVPPKSDETMHAAGGMLMSAEDAGIWLRAQLGGGRANGRRRLPAGVVASTHERHAAYDVTADNIRRIGYALGWQIGILDGDTLYHHLGNYPGAFAHVSFIPSRGLGVAVFANSDMPAFAPVTGTIATRAYDLVLGRRNRERAYVAFTDSIGPRRDRMAAIFRADYRRRAERPQVPPRGWGVYTGQYYGGDMGSLSIVARGDSAAELRYGQIHVPLEVFSGDTLRVDVPPGRTGRPMPVTFGTDGSVSSVTVAGTAFIRIGERANRSVIRSPVADSLMRLDSLWARIYAVHDTAAAYLLYADDLVWTSVTGAQKDKRGEIADVRPMAGLVMEYFRTLGVEVRVYDGAAVITGLAEWKYTMNGTPAEIRRRYTVVYVRGGPLGWRIAAVHMGRAA